MEKIALGKIIKSAKVERCGDRELPIMSITKKDGIVLQSEKFKKRIASKDASNYLVIPSGKLVQGIHIDEGNFGIQDIVSEGIVSPAYKVWNVDESKVYPKYLEMVLRSPRSIEFYKSKLTGTVHRRGRMRDSDFLGMKIPYPSIDKQKYIVYVINQVNRLIELREKEIFELDTLIKSRFVEMFYDKGYSVLKWNDVFNTTTGKLDSNAMVEDGEYPFFTCAKEVFQINKYAFDQEALLLAGNNAAGKYDVKYYKGKFNAYQRTYVLGLTQDWSYRLFQYQLEDKLVYLQQQSLGGLTKYLTLKILGELEFIIPPMDKQNEFTAFTEQVDKLKVEVQKSLDKTQVLFDSLMQQYFE